MIVQLQFNSGNVIRLNVAAATISNAACITYKGDTFAYGGMQGSNYTVLHFNEVFAPTDLSDAEVLP